MRLNVIVSLIFIFSLFSCANLNDIGEYRKGVVRVTDSDGNLKKLLSYRDNQLHGPCAGFYPSGKSKWFVIYQQGKKNGIQTVFYENGAVYMTTPFRYGKIDGTVTRFNPNGKKVVTVEVRNDVVIAADYHLKNSSSPKYTRENKNPAVANINVSELQLKHLKKNSGNIKKEPTPQPFEEELFPFSKEGVNREKYSQQKVSKESKVVSLYKNLAQKVDNVLPVDLKPSEVPKTTDSFAFQKSLLENTPDYTENEKIVANYSEDETFSFFTQPRELLENSTTDKMNLGATSTNGSSFSKYKSEYSEHSKVVSKPINGSPSLRVEVPGTPEWEAWKYECLLNGIDYEKLYRERRERALDY